MSVDSEIMLLRERIAKLEAKVEELSKRVDSLSSYVRTSIRWEKIASTFTSLICLTYIITYLRIFR
ncbi:MAG: hypothetical protein LZ172_03055 [Thaumarchaeota archaeon]|jgi:cell division protein FtsL|nr:hypothetical protein [Candidatus Geocrenenecus arthurdayi]MCL7403311.1 hypothetical protein [Candidatus Geocrenenecus arthurdayi]